VDVFSLERVLKKSSVFDLEKLEWLNGQHLMRTPTEQLVPPVTRRLEELGAWGVERGEDDPIDLAYLVELLKPRSRTLEELVEQAVPYLGNEVAFDPQAVKKNWGKESELVVDRLSRVRDILQASAWEEEALEARLRGLAEELGVGAGKIFQPLRVALTGSSASPGIFDVLLVLGRERSLVRMDRALGFLKAGNLPGQD